MKRSRFLVSLLFLSLMVTCCSKKSGARVVPPSGWTNDAIQVTTKGIEVLFAGKRNERESLVVLHVPDMKSKKNARGTIASYLDNYWRKDPKIWMAITIHELEIEGRHPVYMRLQGDTLNPPQMANIQSYTFMTEAGLYQVTYASHGEAQFDLDDFLKNSFLIAAKESSFAQEVVAEFIIDLPRMQAEELKRLQRKEESR